MTTDRQYHAIVRGSQQGPFTREELARLVSRGEVEITTLAWTEGMSVWRPLPEVPGLHNLLADGPPPDPEPQPKAIEAMLPEAVDTALDRVSRSQAFIIGAGLFFGLIALLGIGSIFRFERLALLGFWGSAALAFFAFQAWRQEENQEFDSAAKTALRGAIGAWILTVVSLIFGNIFFGVLQAGAGVLFWLARTELLKQTTDNGHRTSDDAGSVGAVSSSQADDDHAATGETTPEAKTGDDV